MRLVVSGTSGLIGTATRARLAVHHDVATLGRRKGCDFVADLSDPDAVAALDFSGIDALVHCAGVVDEDFVADPGRAFRQATFGASKLVERAIAGGAKRIAYVSSAHTYGPMVGRVDEASPPNPLTDYAIAHFATEQVFRRAADKVEAAALLRPCAVFGIPPDLDGFRRWGLAPFAFPRRAVLEGRVELGSSGDQRRNFVAASDVADVIAYWLENGAGVQALNPVGASSMSVWDFTQLCAREAEAVTGRPCVTVRRESAGRTAGDDFEYESRHPFCQGTADLSKTVHALARAIADKGLTA